MKSMKPKLFGKMVDGKLRYAPKGLKNLEGYKEVVIDEPSTLDGFFLEMDGWVEYPEYIKPLWRVKSI